MVLNNGKILKLNQSSIYNWEDFSTYVKKPPFFDNLSDEPEGFQEIKDARPLLILGDMVTFTDHISPGINTKRKSNWRIFYETSNFTQRL